MKKFLKKRLLGIPLLAILAVVVIVPIAVLAVGWPHTDLTTTGTITVEASEMTYTISNTEVAFGSCVAASGSTMSFDSDVITITNTGEKVIHGFNFIQIEGVPSDLTLTPFVTGDFPLIKGEAATFIFRVAGSAPVEPITIDLSGITVTLTLD